MEQVSEKVGVATRPGPPGLGRHVQAGGLRTNYLEVGEGTPVVLVHGSGPGVSAHANWRVVLESFAPGFRVLAPDMVGFGFTERPADRRYDLGTWVDHLRGFLDAMGLERTHLVGSSWGGALALALAAEYPDRVAHLVLSGSIGVSFPVTDGLSTVWGYTPGLENMRRVAEVLVADRSLVTDDLVQERYAASVHADAQDSYARMFQPPLERRLDALAMPESRIAALPHRTMIVHGRDDRVVPLDVALRFLHLLDQSELHVFARCGHLPQAERPREYGALLTHFLSG